jgi:hypothetical protein
LPRTTTEETFNSSLKLKEETATVKQYQGTSSHDRDPQGVTSAQPAAPSSQKEVSNRKAEEQKKIKAVKRGEHRDPR